MNHSQTHSPKKSMFESLNGTLDSKERENNLATIAEHEQNKGYTNILNIGKAFAKKNSMKRQRVFH